MVITMCGLSVAGCMIYAVIHEVLGQIGDR